MAIIYKDSVQGGATFNGGTDNPPKFTTADSFIFDTATVSAASLTVSGTTTATIVNTVATETYIFTDFDIKKIAATKFTFEDGSKLLIGDGATGTLNDDLANLITGTENNDYIDGLLGSDTVSYKDALSGVTINLTAGNTGGGAGVDNLVSIENATGSIFGDTLTAKATGSKLDGGGGIDSLVGGAGNDTFVITAGDLVTDASTDDHDLVSSSIDYALPANVENLTLISGAFQGVGNGQVNILTGTTSKNILDGGVGADSLIGLGGDDTYLFGTGDTITEASNAGTDLVISSVDVTLAANVENLRLSGTAAGIGNTLDNLIYAGVGASDLDGGVSGVDTLSYQYGATAGVTANLAGTVSGGSGNDTIHNFDNLIGTRFNDTLTGTASANKLIGGAGHDKLTGLGGTGDVLEGGTGNDTYVVTTTTGVTFKDLSGVDTLESAATSGTVTMSAFSFLENLTLTDATGTNTVNGTGNSGKNVLQGGDAKNTLDGAGESDVLAGGGGANTLKGGTGNDTYLITTGTDTIIEAGGAGTDLVISNATFNLATNVENLTVGTAAITNGVLEAITTGTTGVVITGNGLANLITGGTGTDTLNGGALNDTLIGDVLTGADAAKNDILDGGTGNDTMKGGGGNDTYKVDSTADVVTEVAKTTGTEAEKANFNGIDTVESGITYTLGVTLENLTLTGTATINGTGNNIDNIITGNTADNTLNGSKGADTLSGGDGNDVLNGGANTTIAGDRMSGGTGDDTYVVDHTTFDTVTEAAGGGTDLVQSSVTYTLPNEVDNLMLTGSSAINGNGNSAANTLTGNSGNNTLIGGGGVDSFIGGAGKDTLTGDTGVDTFVYRAASESTVALFDVITSFVSGDKIDVSAIFGAETVTVRNSSTFDAGTAGSEIIFNDTTDKASFDVDGNDTADFVIQLTGVASLNTGGNDFIF